MSVQKETRKHRGTLLFADTFPQVRGIEVHDVAHNLNLASPHVLRRLPGSLFRRTNDCDRPATPKNRDRLAVLLHLAQDREALGFKLGRVYNPLHGFLIISQPCGHLTIWFLALIEPSHD